MENIYSIMAAIADLESLHPTTAPIGKTGRLLVEQGMIIVATGLTIALILMLWAKYLRKSRRRHSEDRPASAPAQALISDEPEPDSQHRRHHHRRRRRREHRQRNPTLSQTGGLPPPRPGPAQEPPS